MSTISPESMDSVFQALASRSRRRILDILRNRPGSSVNDVCKHFDTSRIAVMKHLGVLEEAQLIASEKVGRTRRLYFNAAPFQSICNRWTCDYSSYWNSESPDLEFDGDSSGEDQLEVGHGHASVPDGVGATDHVNRREGSYRSLLLYLDMP